MRVIFFLIIPFLLSAQITLKELQQSPLGHVRNFYIWQYLQSDINSSEADAAYSLVYGLNNKIFSLYAKKTDKKNIQEKYRCSKLSTKELLQETNASCINRGLSLLKALKLEKPQRKKLSKKLKKDYPQKSKIILLMNEERFVSNLLKSGAKNYLKVFNSVGNAYRQKYFNVKLSAKDINKLAKEKAFNQSIEYIVMDKKMTKMQEALLALSACELNDKSYFLLALNALHFKATNKAMVYLEIAYKSAYYRINKDKALFWMFLVSKDKQYLKNLSSSTDINIYTLYAKEKLNIEVNNYFFERELLKRKSKIDLNNPYVWEKLLKEVKNSDESHLKSMLKKFNTQEDEVLNAFIYSKSLKYKVHNYIMPYKEATKDLSSDEKAVLYALAKQESQFIPSALSRSYALGVMQMMPFLVKLLAKQKKEKVSLSEMFNPYKNISYAKNHIKWIQKSLYHPLFIAYAYNGGLGFTKRYLKNDTFKKGRFEPFLSMELMDNIESREYGKKVLANYIIYKKILGEDVKITSLLETLTEPSRTDRFRKTELALQR